MKIEFSLWTKIEHGLPLCRKSDIDIGDVFSVEGRENARAALDAFLLEVTENRELLEQTEAAIESRAKVNAEQT